ncbi:hypothetical protein W822_01545 [Advenella kashmirensis W13003]|uniref:Uncharacterized protein n=1 Tax=Advenella kashmirensis W13003 TaxID=1424334 RepID=V8QX23_9BURK|nr:hypothetical protein W822_01545 [Advenella kashmirensis W13003]
MHNHQSITLAGVLERALVGRLDPDRLVPAMQAGWALSRPGPDVNISKVLHALDYNTSQS